MQELVSTKDDDTRVTLIDKAAEYPNLSDEGEEMKMPKRIRRFRRQSEEKFPYKVSRGRWRNSECKITNMSRKLSLPRA